MTRLGIQYLTGRSVASSPATLREPEWPPHPGRVFMAMAATYFETSGDEYEREALEWLEEAGAPAVSASNHQPRSFVETYVPVNDKLDANSGSALRARQPRSFATTRPERDCVYLTWTTEIPTSLRPALERLCSKVTRIGHSSSLVQMWLAGEEEETTGEWLPQDLSSEARMRIAEPGTFNYLRREFNQEALDGYQGLSELLECANGKERARLRRQIAENFPQGPPRANRPRLARWQGYARVNRQPAEFETLRGPFDRDLIVLTKNEGGTLGLETTLQLTSALRDAAMKAAGDGVPEWLSGHQPNGSPTLRAHVALFALPFVASEHADGHVMGLAIAIPRELGVEGRARAEAVRRVIGPLMFGHAGDEKTIHLWRSNVWNWKLERENREYPPVTLRARTWTGPATNWASVTPVVLHHYPKRNRDGDVERILSEAFESALLPRPVRLRVQPVSLFEGAGHARALPEFTDGGANLCRYQVHIVVEFEAPVEGPLLVGRGRYRGYGLLRPVEATRG
jgi:CRISPR-associated protein Csb2